MYITKIELESKVQEIRKYKAMAEDPVDYTIRLLLALAAKHVGYESRNDWTDDLKKCPESNYAARLSENRFHV